MAEPPPERSSYHYNEHLRKQTRTTCPNAPVSATAAATGHSAGGPAHTHICHSTPRSVDASTPWTLRPVLAARTCPTDPFGRSDSTESVRCAPSYISVRPYGLANLRADA